MTAPIKSFTKRQSVFNSGERATAFPKLLTGAVILYSINPDGRRQVLDLAGPGDFLHFETSGELDHCGEALTDCQVAYFAPETLMANAENAQFLFEQMRDRLAIERRHIAMLSQKSARERLADFIRLAAECLGEDEGRFELPLTRQQIADFTGLTLETVSRTFARWQREETLTKLSGKTYQMSPALAA